MKQAIKLFTMALVLFFVFSGTKAQAAKDTPVKNPIGMELEKATMDVTDQDGQFGITIKIPSQEGTQALVLTSLGPAMFEYNEEDHALVLELKVPKEYLFNTVFSVLGMEVVEGSNDSQRGYIYIDTGLQNEVEDAISYVERKDIVRFCDFSQFYYEINSCEKTAPIQTVNDFKDINLDNLEKINEGSLNGCYSYNVNGAESMDVTFSDDTYIDSDVQVILYDEFKHPVYFLMTEYNQTSKVASILKRTTPQYGSELIGKPVHVNGSQLKVSFYNPSGYERQETDIFHIQSVTPKMKPSPAAVVTPVPATPAPTAPVVNTPAPVATPVPTVKPAAPIATPVAVTPAPTPQVPMGKKVLAAVVKVKKVKNANSYKVYCMNGKKAVFITKLTNKKLQYTITKLNKKALKTGTTYKFKVVAYKNEKKLNTKYIKVKAVEKTLNVPSPVVKVQLKNLKQAIKVTLSKVTGATGYEIGYSIKKDSGYQYIKVNNKTSFKIKDLKGKQIYYVKVRAYKQLGQTKLYSAPSEIVSVKTK